MPQAISRMTPALFFPIMAASGAVILRKTGIPWINWALLLIISLYLIILATRSDLGRIEAATALFSIALSLAFLHAFRSPYIPIDGDIPFESYVFIDTLKHGWDLNRYNGSEKWMRYIGLTSLTVYPTMLAKITGWKIAVFKIGYRVIEAIIPVIMFAIFDRLTDRRVAFAAAALFPVQWVFITLIGSIARMNVAYVLFFVFVLLLTRPSLDSMRGNWFDSKRRSICMMILLVTTVLSHYTVALVTIFLLIGYLMVREFSQLISQHVELPRLSEATPLSGVFVSIFVAVVFLWYGYVSKDILIGVSSGVVGLITALGSIAGIGGSGGGSGAGASLAAAITKGIYFGTIGIGGIGLLTAWRSRGKYSLFPTWIVLGLVAYVGLGATFISTQFFGGYGPFRMFYQLLPFIAIPIILGVSIVASSFGQILPINRERLAYGFVAIFLVVHLFAGTYAIYDLAGTPHGELFSTKGERVDTALIDPPEHTMAVWLNEYSKDEVQIWGDYDGENIVARYQAIEARDGLALFGVHRKSLPGYVVLRTENVDQSMVNSKYRGKYDINRIRQILKKKNKVYASGAEVYK